MFTEFIIFMNEWLYNSYLTKYDKNGFLNVEQQYTTLAESVVETIRMVET